ncbi:MAG: hypothetical protein A2Y79_08775 [Deltaproteobacteria bacterium RBG_13_43_22]|nr:MAG: hypothetical protein A2Y79_08775 [Deltaproteobacteria bacterium RBG_13_43_22]
MSSYFSAILIRLFIIFLLLLDIETVPGYTIIIISWKFLSKAPEAESIRPCLGHNTQVLSDSCTA